MRDFIQLHLFVLTKLDKRIKMWYYIFVTEKKRHLNGGDLV